MIKNAMIIYHNGEFNLTQIDTDANPIDTIAQRMRAGGSMITSDNRWSKARTLIIDMGDVSRVIVEEP
jgi:hypothetical protein